MLSIRPKEERPKIMKEILTSFEGMTPKEIVQALRCQWADFLDTQFSRADREQILAHMSPEIRQQYGEAQLARVGKPRLKLPNEEPLNQFDLFWKAVEAEQNIHEAAKTAELSDYELSLITTDESFKLCWELHSPKANVIEGDWQ